MRVAIINKTGGGMSGGYRVYLEQILPRLVAHKNIEAVLCAVPPSLSFDLSVPHEQLSFVRCAPFRFFHHDLDANLKNTLARFSPDVIFIPLERHLRISGIPTVTMVQNMGPLVNYVRHNPITEKMRYIGQRFEARLAMKNAEYIIAPTQFVKIFLMEYWRIPSERIHVIHYGSVLPPTGEENVKSISLPKECNKFLFTAGSIQPYRGLEDILQAFSLLKDYDNVDGLVVAGVAFGSMVSYQEKLQIWLRKYGLDKKVYWVGDLSAAEMTWCYRNCLAFVMTSRVESFGVIGLEALAHGCLCIVADNPPFPEIFGDAASYYSSGNGEELAQVIMKICLLDSRRKEIISQHSLARAALFSWERNIEQLVSIFSAAYQRSKMHSS